MATSCVTVCIRLRPFLSREKDEQVVKVDGNVVNIQVDVDQLYGAPEVEERQFVYDHCLGHRAGQDKLYQVVGEPVLNNALDGFNGTLFAYGQTGSGKSFSLMGPTSNPGVIPRLAKQLFQTIDHDTREEPASEIRVTMSFLEIYNEELKDLLDPRPKKKKLYVHQHPKLGVYVPHLTEAATESAEDCFRLLDFGAKIRATAQTNMNSTSSRSHSVLTLRITQVFGNGKIRNSNVHLCDLAGSERVKKSGAQGQRMREGASINNSLSVLGQVISKLAAGADKKGAHVPFRQSKLTHLLMDALSGDSVTTMLANVSPARSEAEESLSTLRFAESVKKIKTKPLVKDLTPEEPDLLLESFRTQIEVLQQALAKDNTCLPGGLSRAIEASQGLMQSFSQRTGARWAEAVEETKALQLIQQQVLQDMCLRVEDVGQLAGVEQGAPYLLNISDDPSLSGCLLYFLRTGPAISTVGCLGPDSIAPNSIVLTGLGIPARLCEIQYMADSKRVTIVKVCPEEDRGRLLLNGRPLHSSEEAELHHGDRIVFGWAFCFRLVMNGPCNPWEEDFATVSQEVLEYSLTTSMQDMGMMRATGYWQSELDRRNVSYEDAEQLMSIIGTLIVQVDEASALCQEVRDVMPNVPLIKLGVGLCVDFMSTKDIPAPVVQVWKNDERRLLAAWPASDFARRLNALRDAHREVVQDQGQNRWAWRLSCEEWWSGDALPDPASDTEEPVPEVVSP